MFTIKGKYTDADVMIDAIDETTMAQIVKMTNHPAFTNKIAIMPDCHAGAGSVIGFTMPIGDKIIPNVVGVDGSCGMLSFEIDKNDYIYENDRETLDNLIRSEVPFGTDVNDYAYNIENRLNYVNMQKQAFLINEHLNEKLGMDVRVPKYNYEYFVDMCKRVGKDLDDVEYKRFIALKNICDNAGIHDDEIIVMIYENTYKNTNHILDDEILSQLNEI